ncbi:uncharacterized protein TM35_000301360 [Trypanosoma theileri]|uniref:Uncharacterized protein n=1 Tax=Trypanosoma theileri TaxID=67003 RepID=A0A1X0NN05_9TRYP|nr:uncharacterized protein TM35_000301360 [Trypanosoma theileri]ORC86096.1 hypothetical protein TM35_000301360 [Trypanosoma theileri]
MARRQRVPRHKEHRRKRNKNPKLSPFQREQQRAKLANQPPITSIKGSQRDYPVNQRGVIQYLMAKRERQLEKKRLREEAAAAAIAAAAEEEKENEKVELTENEVGSNTSLDEETVSCGSSSASDSILQDDEMEEEKKKEEEEKKAPKKKKGGVMKKKKSLEEEKENANEPLVSKKSKKESLSSKTKKTSKPKPVEIVTLNDQFAATLAPPIAAFRTQTDSQAGGDGSQQENNAQTIIAKKKEKKHRKKVEARKERVRQMLIETEKQLQDQLSLTKTGKKRRRGESVDAKDAAFERKLIQMQKEKAAKEALEKREAAKEKQKDDENSQKSKRNRRKQISFTDNKEETTEDAPHRPMRYPNDKGSNKPREFYELVDVVRYGDRVEAPPVFDAVPRHDASITRLAQRLENTTKSTINRKGTSTAAGSSSLSSKEERLKLLSSVGGLGEQKRLERLGLAPAGAVGRVSTAGGAMKLSKEEEMRRLREGVMEAYRRNRRAEVVSRKGVDMQHQFPLFS